MRILIGLIGSRPNEAHQFCSRVCVHRQSTYSRHICMSRLPHLSENFRNFTTHFILLICFMGAKKQKFFFSTNNVTEKPRNLANRPILPDAEVQFVACARTMQTELNVVFWSQEAQQCHSDLVVYCY